MSSINKKHYKELCKTISEIKDSKMIMNFFDDMLTPQERDVISECLQIIKLLKKGLTQRKVADKLGVSVSKVTRGAHVLKYGKGGFDLV